MATATKPAALAAVQGVLATVSAVVLIQSLITSSVIIALNTIGVISLGSLVIGGSVFAATWGDDHLGSIRATAWTVAAVTGLSALLFITGRPLEGNEREANFLTLLGVVALLAGATLVTLAWREIQGAANPGKKCPDCANTVLGEARKCQYCGYRWA